MKTFRQCVAEAVAESDGVYDIIYRRVLGTLSLVDLDMELDRLEQITIDLIDKSGWLEQGDSIRSEERDEL